MRSALRILTILTLLGGIGVQLAIPYLHAAQKPPTVFIGIARGAGCFCPTGWGDCACIIGGW